jgi:hypothetical protein
MVTKQYFGFKNHLWKTLYDIMYAEALITNTETNKFLYILERKKFR